MVLLTAAYIFGISLCLGLPFITPSAPRPRHEPVTAPYPIQPRGEVREP